MELSKAADLILRIFQKEELYTGWLLSVNKKSRKKMGDNASQSITESKAVAGIRELVQDAILIERHLDLTHANPDVTAICRLYVPVEIDRKLYRVKLTVKEYKTGGVKILHALDATEIKHALPGISPSYSGDATLQTGQPDTGRSISITDLMQGVTLSNSNAIHDGKHT